MMMMDADAHVCMPQARLRPATQAHITYQNSNTITPPQNASNAPVDANCSSQSPNDHQPVVSCLGCVPQHLFACHDV